MKANCATCSRREPLRRLDRNLECIVCREERKLVGAPVNHTGATPFTCRPTIRVVRRAGV